MQISIANMQTTAYEIIKEKIIYDDYHPGQKVSEKSFIQDINIGRTPVREALIHLKKDGLIDVIPQSGTFISKIDLKTAQDARFVRENIEKEVVKAATAHPNQALIDKLSEIISLQRHYSECNDPKGFFKMDEEFHRTFYEYTNKEQVWDWLQILNVQLNRFRWLRLKIDDLKWEILIDQHLDILKSIQHEDASKAIKLISAHLHLMLDEEAMLVNSFPDYFIKVVRNDD